MSLQFIYGPSGSGKTRTLYEKIIRQSLEEPGREFLVIVPEQFTLQTQKELVELHPRKGILNIDVLSFQRLAWRVFEEVGVNTHTVLEDTGKNLLLRRVASRQQSSLTMLGSNFRKPGYISQVKSVISELKQYDVSLEQLEEQIAQSRDGALKCKLQDIRTLYAGFQEELQGKYITSEEILEELCKTAEKSDILRGCVIGLDGFTGFTPIQKKLLRRLMVTADKIMVTVTLDAGEDPMRKVPMHRLSYFSRKMIQGLAALAQESRCELDEPVVLGRKGSIRFQEAPALGFLERHLFRPGNAVYGAEQNSLSVHVSKDAKGEAEFAARTIWHLVREEGLRYREIAVITGDMASFGDPVKKIFAEYEIPCFLDRTRKIILNPMIEFLRAALEIAAKSFRYESMFRYLRTGLTGLSVEEIDLLENYVLARGIRSRKRWEEDWNTPTKEISPEEVEKCQKLKGKILGPLCAFVDQVKGNKGTVRQKTEALYQLLVHYDIQKKMAEYEQLFTQMEAFDTAGEYHQIYGIVMELFDKMAELLGDEPMSLSEYMEILDAGFEEAKVGMIPATSDCVLVGDMERTRLKDIKVLFLLGLNDGWVPRKEEKSSILSDMDREVLEESGMELAPTSRENSYIQKFYLYLNLTKPSRRLYLSCGRMAPDGKALRPSYVIGTILRMFPGLKTEDEDVCENPIRRITSPRSGLPYLTEGLRKAAVGELDGGTLGLYGWYEQQEDYREKVRTLLDAAFLTCESRNMSAGAAKALYGQTLVNSVSRLEQFSACAYAHFLRYGLQISERETFEFKPVDMGNIFHRVIECYSRKVEESEYTWFTIPKEEQERLTEETVNEVSEEYAGFLLHSSARNDYMIVRMHRIMRRTIWALTNQVRAGKFVPVNFEVSFTTVSDLDSVNILLSEEEKMKLRGRIDRIDTCEFADRVFVKVVDYKSGNSQFDLVALYYGLQLQLVVYLNAALELEKRLHPRKKIVPAGIFYYHMQDPMLEKNGEETQEQVQRRILKKLCPNGLVNADPDAVSAMDVSFEKTSDVIPVAKNKDGSYSRASSVAAGEQFEQLSRFVTEKMKEIGCSILAGEADAAPYERKGQTACDYCPFGAICLFDRKVPGTRYRRLREWTPQEIWEFLQEDE